jgi:hypothetical protein
MNIFCAPIFAFAISCVRGGLGEQYPAEVNSFAGKSILERMGVI